MMHKRLLKALVQQFGKEKLNAFAFCMFISQKAEAFLFLVKTEGKHIASVDALLFIC